MSDAKNLSLRKRESIACSRQRAPCGQTLVNNDNNANLLHFGLSPMGGLTVYTNKARTEEGENFNLFQRLCMIF